VEAGLEWAILDYPSSGKMTVIKGVSVKSVLRP